MKIEQVRTKFEPFIEIEIRANSGCGILIEFRALLDQISTNFDPNLGRNSIKFGSDFDPESGIGISLEFWDLAPNPQVEQLRHRTRI